MEEGIEADEDCYDFSNGKCQLPVLQHLVSCGCGVAGEPLACCLCRQLSILCDLRISTAQASVSR